MRSLPRRAVLVVCLGSSLVACLEAGHEGARLPPPQSQPKLPSVKVTIAPVLIPVGKLCYALDVARHSDGTGVVDSVGNPLPARPTLADALAAGAVCVAPEESGTVELACDPSVATNYAHLWLLDGYDDAGARMAGLFDDASDVCNDHRVDNPAPVGGPGATLAFACAADAEASVVFSLAILASPNQGFFDVAVNYDEPVRAADPSGLRVYATKDVCYALRVTDGAGRIVWTENHVCASEYGNGGGGDVAYVGACRSCGGDNVVTLWLTDVERTDGGAPAWTHPCAAEGPLVGDPLQWTGGCTQTLHCLESQDMNAVFALDLEEAPAAPPTSP